MHEVIVWVIEQLTSKNTTLNSCFSWGTQITSPGRCPRAHRPGVAAAQARQAALDLVRGAVQRRRVPEEVLALRPRVGALAQWPVEQFEPQ